MSNIARDNYREVKNKDVYSDDCCMQPSASFSDDYVKWLEEHYETKIKELSEAYQEGVSDVIRSI